MKKNKKTSSAFVFLLIVICLLSFPFLKDYIGFGDSEHIEITIPSGATTRQIAAILEENDIIEHPVFFRIMSKLLANDGKYLEGNFAMTENMGYSEIFKKLSSSPDANLTVKVTIPEGYEFRQIVDLLEENGLIDRNEFINQAQNGNFDYDFLKNLPKRENRLEGYLFPDTYIFDSSSTEKSILNTMLARFDEVFEDEYEDRAEEIGMSIDEVITLASVIEREAQGDVDREKVASVFHNRLKSKSYPYLESCATIQYVLKDRKAVLSNADTHIDSPYNTYKNPGLPIGPIASPGKSSILAALYPADTKYLFFVLDKNGNHAFSETFDEHLQNAAN